MTATITTSTGAVPPGGAPTPATISGSGSATFSGLAPGSYTVTESPNPDFVPVGSTSCNAQVGPGATFTCAFTNNARGSLKVIKNTTESDRGHGLTLITATARMPASAC